MRNPMRVLPTSATILLVIGLIVGAPGGVRLSGAHTSPSEPTPPQFVPVTSDSPHAAPQLDARPLMDWERALGHGPDQQKEALKHPATSPLRGANVEGRLKPVMTELNPDTARPAPIQSYPAHPPKALGEAGPTTHPPAPDYYSGCLTWLYNPTLDDATGWYAYVSDVYIWYDDYYTWPNSLNIWEDADGDPPSGGDYDAFGQEFYFPSNYYSLQVEYKVRYSAGGYSAGDYAPWAMYLANPDGSLGTYITGADMGQYPDTDWHWEGWYLNHSASIDAMRGQQIVLTFWGVGDGVNPALDVYVDDVVLKLCPTTTVPTGWIVGDITQVGTPFTLQDALLLLTYYDYDGLEVIDYTFPDPDGAYAFSAIDALPGGAEYQIWFFNDAYFDDRLLYWAGPRTTSFPSGYNWFPNSFDINNVYLNSPPHESESIFPVNFSWASRGIAGDQFYLCLYDSGSLLDYDTVCTSSPTPYTNVTLDASSFSGVPGFLRYGHRYAWYANVIGPGYDYWSQIGESFYANSVTFLTAPPPPYQSGPPPSGGAPSTGTSKEWLLMVYMAGDNNLGDGARTGPTSLMSNHFEALKQLAVAYPSAHIVTLTDFYDNTGTRLCWLRPDGGQTCQQKGELDTSNPATLTDFLNTAISNFPANRHMLVIANHGHALAGLAMDVNTKRLLSTTDTAAYNMTPDEIFQAFDNANLGGKLDVVFFNNCLMGNLEAAHNLKDQADYLVASANEIWMLDIYSRLLPLLTAGNTSRNVAIGVVNAYKQAVDEFASGYSVSSAAYDLSKVDAVVAAVSNLGATMSYDLSYSRADIDAIRTSSQTNRVQLYDSSGDNRISISDAFVDLRDLATKLNNATLMPNDAIRAQASAVLSALGPVGGGSSLVIASQHVSGQNGSGQTHDLADASGLSLYFPDRHAGTQATLNNMYFGQPLYSAFQAATAWDEFLWVYIDGLLGDPETNTGGAHGGDISSGPVSVQSGTIPIAGTVGYNLFLPFIRR